MGHRVQIGTAYRAVQLPSGDMLLAGQQSVITDAEFDLIRGDWVGTRVLDVDSTVDDPLEGDPLAALNEAKSYANATKVGKGTLLFNVKDYGATGDGTTDDTAAINLAEVARAASATGGTLYFPPGIYIVGPSGDVTNKIAIVIRGTNFDMRGAGAGRSTIRMKTGAGDWLAMFGNGTGGTLMTGLTVKDITLDGNSAGNVITDVSISSPLRTNRQRYAIRFFSGQRALIRDCRFVNWDNINTLSLNSSNAADIAVKDCIFDNVGANSSFHDHSTIYIAAQRYEVSGCTFVGGGISATTAIETHGGWQAVHDNRIVGFYTGANITGVAAPGSIGVVVTNNIMSGCAIGVEMWAWTYTGNNSPWGMEHVRISGNNIRLSYDAWTSVTSQKCGIGFDALSSLGLNDVMITDNQITFDSFASAPTASDNLDAGILLRRSSAYAGVDQDITIRGNVITGPIGGGIYVNLNNTSTDRLKISDNRIIDVAQNYAGAFAAAYKVGVQLTGVFSDVRISRNEIIDTRNTAVMVAGVDVQFVTTATNCEVVDNVVRWGDTATSNPELIVATSSAAAFYLRHRANKYAALTRPTLAGSTVMDGVSGTLYTQVTTPTGSLWKAGARGGSALSVLPRSNFYSTTFGAHATVTAVLNTAYATPLWLAAPGTVTRIACEMTTVQTSSLVRLGIYADDGNGAPGSLLVDAGTVDGSQSGMQEATLGTPLLLASPGLYWLAGVVQGVAGTIVLRSAAGTSIAGSTAVGGANGIFGTPTSAGWTMTGVTGALPANWTINTTSGVPILVAVRWQ